jgi:hypothetical protein
MQTIKLPYKSVDLSLIKEYQTQYSKSFKQINYE